ncbi:SAM-dependent methyltransferase [Mycobacterium sp. 134]|uniref:SAM-dependent methyltransferase n=1 Tax=Mycobacterium sp. 134 TaxID=3400425 RepID=UPI003AAB7B5A
MPWRSRFVDAARQGFSAQRWATLEGLADQFYEGRSVAVRLVDDRVRNAVDSGVRQIVMLGAGLDTRAFRMALPADVNVFEIDLPELIAFKEPVLANRAAAPTCRRHVIAADLREDWTAPLRESGFRPESPTLWVDEGALAYLPPGPRRDVVADLTRLSAPGSRFGVSRYSVDANSAPYTGLAGLVGGSASGQAPRETVRDVREWLDSLGWDTEFQSWNEAVTRLNRAVTQADSEVGHIAAVLRPSAH